MIFIAGITIAILIEFLLLAKKEKTDSDKILTIWMFVVCVHLFLFYLDYSDLAFEYPFVLGLIFPLPLLEPVLLYLYVASMTNLLPRKRSLLLIHLLPTVACFGYLIPFFLLPVDQKIWVFQNDGAGYELFMFILLLTVSFSGIFYVSWSLILLRKHRKNILDEYSNTDKVDLQWLIFLVTAMGMIWLAVIFEEGSQFTFMGVVLFVFLIAFFGIRQVRIIDPMVVQTPPQSSTLKYAKSGLSLEASDELYRALKNLMSSDELYKNGELSIRDLSTRLDVHPNYLSQVINEKEQCNFYDYINHHRLEEFKKLVADPKKQKLTLLAIAYECGFNSKSSFNRYFKKSTGQTPSQYFQNIRQQVS